MVLKINIMIYSGTVIDIIIVQIVTKATYLAQMMVTLWVSIIEKMWRRDQAMLTAFILISLISLQSYDMVSFIVHSHHDVTQLISK